MKMFSKKAICKRIAQASGVAYEDIVAIVNLFLEQIKIGLMTRQRIFFKKFGTLYVIEYKYKDKPVIKVVLKLGKLFKEAMYERNKNKTNTEGTI